MVRRAMRMRIIFATLDARSSSVFRKRVGRGQRQSRPVFEVLYTRDAAEIADVIMILVPDELAPGVYRDDITPALTSGKYLAFATWVFHPF